MSAHSFRAAKRRGLRVIPSGRRVYIRGSDFIDYLNGISQSGNVAVAAGN